MRAFFEDSLLDALNPGKEIEVFDSPVLVKPIPDDARAGVLDPRELELARKSFSSPKPMAPSLEALRQETGFPNINLNTVEIHTKVFSLSYEGVPFELWMYVPRKPYGVTDRKAVIYVHGGSFIAGSVYAEENPMKYLAELSGCAVFNLEYSLAPEHPFPCALEQVKCAIEYVKENAKELGIDGKKIYLCGDSAGANLVLGACQSYGLSDFEGLILYYPAVALNLESLPFQWKESDYEMSDEHKPFILPRLSLGRSDQNVGPLAMLISSFYLRHGESRDDVRVSPLYHNGSLFPKILMFTAEYDGLRIQDEYFASKVNKEGGSCRCIRYRGIHHGFIDKFGYFPQASDAIIETARFLEE